MTKQTIELNGVTLTIEETPKAQQPVYSREIAYIMHTLTDLLQADCAPNLVGECAADDFMSKFATDSQHADGDTLETNDYEQAIYDLASACEDFANALANFDCKVDINYLSRRDK